MRRIVHISDIHFGRIHAGVLAQLTRKMLELDGDLIVVSGDLTQRAKKSEFLAARKFLDQFAQPKVVVPGNHDVPMFNFLRRFFGPYRKYDRYLGIEREPVFVDDEVAVVGINTARSLVVKAGRINDEQVERVREVMCPLPEKMLKVIVTHHPFDLPGDQGGRDIVGRAKEMMPRLVECGADVFLAGHLHMSGVVNSSHRYRMESGYNALIVQAGTAASTRERGEPNSFNVLEFNHPILTLDRYECIVPNEGFRLGTTEQFTSTDVGWARIG